MPGGDARWARVCRGLPSLAEVSLDVEPATEPVEVQFACQGRGFLGQGRLEEVPREGYAPWRAGAREGVRFAMEVAELSPVQVTITRIAGLSTDTNPTTVAIAAALAVWKAVGFSPSTSVMARLEAAAAGSWAQPADAAPRLA